MQKVNQESEPFKLVQYSRYIGVPMGPDREHYLNIAGKTFLDHVGRHTQTLLTIPSYLHATKRLTFLLENFSIPFSPTYFVFNPSLSLSLSLMKTLALLIEWKAHTLSLSSFLHLHRWGLSYPITENSLLGKYKTVRLTGLDSVVSENTIYITFNCIINQSKTS